MRTRSGCPAPPSSALVLALSVAVALSVTVAATVAVAVSASIAIVSGVPVAVVAIPIAVVSVASWRTVAIAVAVVGIPIAVVSVASWRTVAIAVAVVFGGGRISTIGVDCGRRISGVSGSRCRGAFGGDELIAGVEADRGPRRRINHSHAATHDVDLANIRRH